MICKKLYYVYVLVILQIVFLGVLQKTSTCYAVYSEGEFELYTKQAYTQADIESNNADNLITMFNSFLNSNVYNQYKDDIPFDEASSLFIRYNASKLQIFCFDNNISMYIDSNGYIKPNESFTMLYRISFIVDSRSWSWTYEDVNTSWVFSSSSNSFNVRNQTTSGNWFTLYFSNNTLINQYDFKVYGLNYTCYTPVYNGSTSVDLGQYYKLSTGFIGSFYYNDLSNIEYKVICNDSTEYIGLTNKNYTSTSNGEILDFYIYVESSMNQKGYKLVTYYKNEVLYQETVYNTLLVVGGSSGDSSGGSSINLNTTNNLISSLTLEVKSGDIAIINTIKSGDNSIIAAIESGNNNIINTINDDSEVNSLLGDIYSSGDDINDLVSEFNFIQYDNPYHNLIIGSIQNFCNALLSSGDYYIDLTYPSGTTRRLYSSEITVPSGIIKTFISGFLVFGVLFTLYNYFRKSIDTISSGDTKKVLDNIEVDTNFINM